MTRPMLIAAALLLRLAATAYAGPPDGDHGGPPPDNDHRGPPSDDDHRGPPPMPPPEAFAACANAAAGAACTVPGPDGAQHAGSCVAPPGKVLACRPADLPPPPEPPQP